MIQAHFRYASSSPEWLKMLNGVLGSALVLQNRLRSQPWSSGNNLDASSVYGGVYVPGFAEYFAHNLDFS